MFLSIWVVWFLLVASAGCSAKEVRLGHVIPPCCERGSNYVPGTIQDCFEQKPSPTCPGRFYLVDNGNGMYCINPDSRWLRQKMEKGNLRCPPPQTL